MIVPVNEKKFQSILLYVFIYVLISNSPGRITIKEFPKLLTTISELYVKKK